jgi:hypothetical protein
MSRSGEKNVSAVSVGGSTSAQLDLPVSARGRGHVEAMFGGPLARRDPGDVLCLDVHCVEPGCGRQAASVAPHHPPGRGQRAQERPRPGLPRRPRWRWHAHDPWVSLRSQVACVAMPRRQDPRTPRAQTPPPRIGVQISQVAAAVCTGLPTGSDASGAATWADVTAIARVLAWVRAAMREASPRWDEAALEWWS